MQVVIQGILTNYEQVGEGKTHLLILHGWGRSLQEWRKLAQKLARYCTVTLLDLPGFGATGAPKNDWDTFAYAKFVEDFIIKLNLEPCVLVGHSFGGRLGIILGSKKEIVQQLILVDTGGIEEKSLGLKIRARIISFLKPLVSEKLRRKVRTRFGSSDYRTAGELQDIFVRVVNQDLEHLVCKIKVPTLVIWGEKDRVVPLWHAVRIKKALPATTLRVVWEAGHDPHLNRPEELLEIVEEVLC